MNESIVQIHNKEIKVDTNIATYIQQLNDAGWLTQFSCSGMEKDHIGIQLDIPLYPYITFDLRNHLHRKKIKRILLMIAIDLGWNYHWILGEAYVVTIELDQWEEMNDLINQNILRGSPLWNNVKNCYYIETGYTYKEDFSDSIQRQGYIKHFCRFWYKRFSDDQIEEKLRSLTQNLVKIITIS